MTLLPGFIRTPWLENFYETLYASNEPGFYIPYTVVFQYRRIYAAYFSDSEGAAAASSKFVMSIRLRVLVGCVQKVDKIADLGPEQVLEGLKVRMLVMSAGFEDEELLPGHATWRSWCEAI